jgi:hypothetical protein
MPVPQIDANGSAAPLRSSASRRSSCAPTVRKPGMFEVQIDGLGLFQFDLFEPSAREPFVAPRSIRSKFSGAYERTFKLEESFAAELLDAAVSRRARDAAN